MEILNLIRAQWDRVAAVAFTLLGLLMVLLGWVGVSGANLVVKELPYIMSGGIGGIVLVAVGAALWVSSDLRDEWSELRRLRLTLDWLEQQHSPLITVEQNGDGSVARHTRRPATPQPASAVAVGAVGNESVSRSW